MKIKRYVDLFVKSGVIISLTGMILSVVIQVFSRFFLESAPHWTEEAARIFFIFSVAFGSGLAIRDHGYVQLDYFLDKFHAKTKYRIQMIIHVVIILFGILISFYSIKFIRIGSSETSPSLHINMAYVFSSILILGILIVYYSAIVLVVKTKQKNI